MDMPAFSSGGNNVSPFTITLDPAFACGQTIDFTLTVSYTGGPQRALSFTVPTGLLSITNTLGSKPTEVPGVTTATGTQTGRINRNGVVSSCGTPKSFPGTIAGSHVFDSYTFTACRSFCMEVGLDAGSSGSNLFTSAYSPSYDSSSIGTNYTGDTGLSTASQTFSVDATAASTYSLVVNDVAGNASANTYTIQIPACAFNCNVNHLPMAVAQDVSVIAANTGGTAAANIDNGSSDPDSDVITLTQIPVGPYPVGTTSVILTVIDTKGATAQTTANVTVIAPGFGIAATLPSVNVTAGQSVTDHVTFTPNPGIGADMTLACSGLPAGATCTFVPTTVAAGSAQTDVVVTVVTAASSAAAAHPRIVYAAWLPFMGMGVIGLLFTVPAKRRRAPAGLLLIFLFGAIGLMPACSGVSTPAPKNHTYTVTVTGTSGNVTHTTNFSLSVN